VRITNDWVNLASASFYVAEYWHGVDFDLPDSLIQAGQILRDWAGVKMTATNSYPDGNSFGYHRLMKASDWDATNVNDRQPLIEKYNQELANYISGKGSDLIDKLRSVGITGLGRETQCIHLDVRPTPFDATYNAYSNHKDKYGDYTCFAFSCYWDSTGKMIITENCAI
jgi:hypothetical protein